MTTEIILTDDAIHKLIVDLEIECDCGIETYPVDNIVPFARAIEQAVVAKLVEQATEAYPCRIVETDFETGTVTLEMQGKYTVSSGQKYLCDAPLQSQDREYALEAENVKLREALEMMVEMVEMNGFGRDYAMDVARAALAQKQEKA